MKHEWKPGDVASTLRNKTQVALRTGKGWTYIDGSTGGVRCDDYDFRPLAVIDPEDREAVERLVSLNRLELMVHPADTMQAALREFANPKPPRPDEPQGLGAVVEDGNGVLWIRMSIENQTWPGEVWQEQYGVVDRWSKWSDIAAVRVLSEGVQP